MVNFAVSEAHKETITESIAVISDSILLFSLNFREASDFVNFSFEKNAVTIFYHVHLQIQRLRDTKRPKFHRFCP
jgi:hypothetical protein